MVNPSDPVKDVFLAALAKPTPADRAAYLDAACSHAFGKLLRMELRLCPDAGETPSDIGLLPSTVAPCPCANTDAH